MQPGSVADGGWRITSESSAPDGRYGGSWA